MMYVLSKICFFFFQAEDGIRDSSVTGVQTCALPISLVLGCKLQLGGVIIVQPMPQNFQNFAGRFSRRANNEDAPKLLLILSIAPFQRHLYGFVCCRSLLLFLFGPRRRLCRNRLLGAGPAHSRMTLERLKPIRFAEGAPNFIRRREQRGFISDRPFRSHALAPGFRPSPSDPFPTSFFL